MKKEFEGAASASTDKNVFEPKLVTIQDENAVQNSSVGIVPMGSQEASSAVLPDELEQALAASATAGLPPLPPQGGMNPLAAKLEATRKFSQSFSEAEFDIEEEDDFDPHFQRVYISGDDNTGVSKSSRVHSLLMVNCFSCVDLFCL